MPTDPDLEAIKARLATPTCNSLALDAARALVAEVERLRQAERVLAWMADRSDSLPPQYRDVLAPWRVLAHDQYWTTGSHAIRAALAREEHG
jgi:hypothetical protein